MRSLFAQIRTARDILANRLPAALAMLKAKDVSIATRSRGNEHWIEVYYYFDGDAKACGEAYRRVEYLYQMDRDQKPAERGPTRTTATSDF